MKYGIVLTIGGRYNLKFEDKQISLGSQIKETLDKSYDIGTFEILMTNEPNEFQPYTPVYINIFEEVDLETGKNKNKNYYMIIESDKVSDVYVGTETFYNHQITLIEATKLLETELMPNITFTQPVANIVEDIEWLNEPKFGINEELGGWAAPDNLTWAKSVRGYGMFNAPEYSVPKNKLPKKIYPGYSFPSIKLSFNALNEPQSATPSTVTLNPNRIVMYNLDNPSISYELGSQEDFGTITCPDAGSYHTVRYSYTGCKNTPVVPENIVPGRYRLRYTYSLTDIEFCDQIGIVFVPINGDWNSVYSDKTFVVYFNGIPMDQHVSCNTVNQKDMSYEDIMPYMWCEYTDIEVIGEKEKDVLQPIYMDEFLDKIQNQITVMSSNLTMIDSETITSFPSAISGSFKVFDFSFDIQYPNFERKITLGANFDKTSALANIQSNLVLNFLDKDGSIIQQMTQKVKSILSIVAFSINVPKNCTRVEAKYYYGDTGAKMTSVTYIINLTPRPKYKFSDVIMSKASTIPCPEYTFEKKTLWEICLEIGEIFGGIPVLDQDNIIDYLIVNNNIEKTINFEKELEVKESNMTNYATKLYTPELKNIIHDDDENEVYCVYPSPTGWASVRANDYNEVNIDRQSSAFVIEGENTQIYKLVKFECIMNNNTNKIYDLTDYVLEKNIWNSLSNAADSALFQGTTTSKKGTFAYYERGGNVIMNLAQLPKNASITGWKQQYLTIQFMLNASPYGLNYEQSSKNIFDYKFRVTYVPYHTRLNISKQSNLNDIYNQITINFNQTSNTVSATQFSKYAENTVKKLGNPTITTAYTSETIDDELNVGNYLILNNKNYYINSKLDTFNNRDKSVLLELTKDNYKQNDRIAVSREYRQYNIDSQNQLRKTLSKPYTVIISNNNIDFNSETSYIKEFSSNNKTLFRNSIYDTLNPSSTTIGKITNAYIKPEKEDGNLIEYGTYIAGESPRTVNPKILPVIGEVIGNTITFQWDMYDNYSAGRKVRNPSSDTNSWWDNLEINIGGLTLKEKQYGIKLQDDTRYVDDNGQTPRIKTIFFSPSSTALGTQFGETLPDLNSDFTEDTLSTYAKNKIELDFKSLKDSREQLSCQLTFSAQTFDKDISIYNLLQYNPLIRKNSSSPVWYGYTKDNLPTDYDYYNFNSKYSLTQTFSNSSYKNDPYTKCTLKNNTSTDFLGYILCYPNGEKLVDIRKPVKAGASVNVFFTIYNDELANKDII